MWLYYFAIGIVIVSNVLYHICQKSTPGSVNPVVALSVTYATALVCSVMLLPLFPLQDGILGSFKKLNWASVALGIAIVGIEFGFLLAYRAGWDISIAQFFATVMITLVLLPIGLLFYQEKLSLINIFGILLCIGGFVLINYKKTA